MSALRLSALRLPPGWLVLVLGAVALALTLHHEALLVLGTAIPGEKGSDALRAMWSAWLVAEELPGWPFGTTLTHFPAGVNLLPFPAATLVFAAPLSWLFGAKTAVTLISVSHTLLAVLTTGFLVRTLGGGYGGALVAGALVATQPILGGALRDGTLEVQAIGWVPLAMGCMIRACRGSWPWGVLTGLVFLITCVESVYYGSMTAVAMVACLSMLRTRGGLAGAATAALTVALGVGMLAMAFAPVISGVLGALAQSGDDPAALRAANAARIELLQQLARSPGSRGWRVGDLYAPPMIHWGAFAAGALLSIRRTPWLTVLAGAFLLLALDHPLTRFWAEGPIGEVVRFPRRYMAVVGVALGAGLGVGLKELLRRPGLELVLGVPIAAWLALWGAHAGGQRLAYPLLELPEPAFAQMIAADPEDCAALFLPLERPGGQDQMRDEAPVFASLSDNLASADQLALHVLMDKAGWTAPSLVTLAKRSGPTGLIAKSFTDLSLPVFGGTVPSTSLMPTDAYLPDLNWLMGEGLKYVVVDRGAFRDTEIARLRMTLDKVAVEVLDYDEGDGVLVFRLYDERPARTEVPSSSASGVAYAGFMGRVEGWEGLRGRVIIKVTTEEGKVVDCPITPENGAFQCGNVKTVKDVVLTVDAMEVPMEWEGSSLDVVIHPKPLSGEP